MTGEIVNLADARAAREDTYLGTVCPECGGGWFSGLKVCMAQDGRITGWTGTPVCTSCEHVMQELGL